MQQSGQHPPTETKIIKGELWIKYPQSPDILSLGVAPVPRNARETFIYHVCHGLIMRYPLIDILVWSWRNRNSFKD
jgi:hypothetical protein